MKSIFKKIAFVLALAMVVTMLPARAVSAAESDGPQMYTTLRLYIGGDVTGTYDGQRYAKVWNKDGYEVAFESSDESVATVNSKGYVTAVKVGSATVTATFTAEDGSEVVKECVVTVKKNAAVAGLGSASSKLVTEEGIKVGETVQLTAVRKDADGNMVWTGRDVITDGVRFSSSDTEIFTVQKTTGKITGVSAGEATLYVWAVQSEGRDPETGEYPATTDKKEYKVIVKEDAISVEQSASNAFTIVFPDADAAKAAVDATLPSLTNASASVSEDKAVVKTYEVLIPATDNAAAVEQEVFISDISYTQNIVTVTLFNELKEETTYTVRYQDYVENFVTCKNVAVKLVAYDWTVTQSELAVEKEVSYLLYAAGVNGQDVNITYSTAYGEGSWTSSVKLEDLATTYDPKYVFNGNTIWFYTLDQGFTVNLEATFEDWYIVQGTEANVLKARIAVTPGNTSITAGNIVSWGIVALNSGNDYSTQQLAVEDIGYRLAVKASINIYGTDDTVETVAGGLNDKFTFVSSNDDKLAVDEETGEIYPPKSAVSNVLVHVYYDGTYIGSCAVTVVAKRMFTSLAVYTDGKTKLAAGENFFEALWYEVKTYDQLGAEFYGGTDGSITIDLTVSDSNKATYVELGSWDWKEHGSGNNYQYMSGADYVSGITVTKDAPDKATPILVVVTATYRSNDGKVVIEKKSSFSFSVKNTDGGEAKSYTIEVGSTSMDEALYVLGNTANTTVASKVTNLSAYSVDKDGYKIRQLSIDSVADNLNSGDALATGTAKILVKKGNENITTKGTEDELGFVKTSDTEVRFTAVGTVTVSGASITTTGSAIEKIETGSYVVNLFVGENGKATYKASQVISVVDSQDIPTFKWIKTSVNSGSDIDIAKDALRLYFDADRNWVVDDVTEDIVAADITRVGNRATINSVTYNWVTPNGEILTFVVPINRTVVFGN